MSLQVTDEIVEEGGQRIKPEFKATENDYRNYATDPDGGYETEFVENTVEEVKDLTSDLTKVKSFATKKGPTMEEIVISKKKRVERKVLIITYYWPPAGGPGVQRWLKFVKYLFMEVLILFFKNLSNEFSLKLFFFKNFFFNSIVFLFEKI